jgi:hypothetical protein
MSSNASSGPFSLRGNIRLRTMTSGGAVFWRNADDIYKLKL